MGLSSIFTVVIIGSTTSGIASSPTHGQILNNHWPLSKVGAFWRILIGSVEAGVSYTTSPSTSYTTFTIETGVYSYVATKSAYKSPPRFPAEISNVDPSVNWP